jgi:RalA-binding protein 1
VALENISNSFQEQGHEASAELASATTNSGNTRLTPSDLPFARVKVHGSNIKANDRGKEVLSFIFAVHPASDAPLAGSGPTAESSHSRLSTEPWLIEKLYSDVLSLDATIRSRIGKTAGKKLPPLPDAKLFKDHAPAKVDQRKVRSLLFLIT